RRVAGEQVLRTVRLDPPGGERELALEEVAAEPRAAQAAWFLGLLEPELDAAHRDAHDQRIAPDHPDREVLVAVVDVAAVLAAVHAEEERHAAELAEVRLDPEPGVRLRRRGRGGRRVVAGRRAGLGGRRGIAPGPAARALAGAPGRGGERQEDGRDRAGGDG